MLPTRVPAGFLYFLWTYSFPSAAVEAWRTDRQTDRQTHPIRPFRSKMLKAKQEEWEILSHRIHGLIYLQWRAIGNVVILRSITKFIQETRETFTIPRKMHEYLKLTWLRTKIMPLYQNQVKCRARNSSLSCYIVFFYSMYVQCMYMLVHIRKKVYWGSGEVSRCLLDSNPTANNY
jgi:hypothetical protein